MAQNVTIAGASYTGVPSVNMPTTGGGTSSFYDVSDTTATASDVASGKVFYTASGAKATGTASGGITPTGTISITANGTYDVTQYASADVDVPSGGSDDPPNDGNTHLFIEVPNAYKTFKITVSRVYSGSSSLIDWGDGTTSDLISGSNNHTYASAGNYHIVITVTTGTWQLATSALGNSTAPTGLITDTYRSSRMLRRAYFYDEKLTYRGGTGTVFGSCVNLVKCIFGNTSSGAATSMFQYCYSLEKAVLPSGITSFGTYVFRNCELLEEVEIPATVTSMGNNVFYDCCNLQNIVFLSETPPTATTSTFSTSTLKSTCVIHVPAGTLAAYTAAENYPDPATYTYVED